MKIIKNKEKEKVNRSETQQNQILDHKKYQHKSNYLKAAAECTSRANLSVKMHDGPVKSVKNFQQVEAINRSIGKKSCNLHRVLI